MIKLEVGKYISGTPRRYDEGVRFDIDDSGASLVAYFKNPTQTEITNFKTGGIKLGFYSYQNVIMLLAKIGELNWVDAPYSVHLSKNLTTLGELGESEGLAITVLLVDASDGTIMSMRLLGANHRLTEGLFKAIGQQKDVSFQDFYKNVNYIFSTYSTKDLIKRASMIENLTIVK
jgi:hypothetical protein